MSGHEPVAVLGGTFDPVHYGHISIAESVRDVLRVDRVLFVPAAVPPHKPEAQPAAEAQRVAMVQLAIEGRERLELSTVETDTGAVCFTLDTLRSLRRDGGGSAFVFVVGLDSVADLPNWREYRTLLREFDFVAFDRARDDDRPDAIRIPDEIRERLVTLPPGAEYGRWKSSRPGRGGRIFRLRVPPVGVSSTAVRRLAAQGAELGALVPTAVARYIRENGLYVQEENR